jgi:hypothetical protein
MPMQIEEENGGKIVAVQVTGKLVKADYERVVPELDRLIRQHGKVSLLFELTGFHGWDAGGLWDEMTNFCKPFTKATIRYFEQGNAPEARKWLLQNEHPAAAA